MKGKEVSQSFFNSVMQKLSITPTPEKLKFFRAWQRAENTNAKFNPLATTKKTSTSEPLPGNSAGVQQYPSESDGVDATVQTLKLPYYTELTEKLKDDEITATELASSTKSLKTWSGGDGTYVARSLGSPSDDIDEPSTVNISTWDGIKEWLTNSFPDTGDLGNRFEIYDILPGQHAILRSDNRAGIVSADNPSLKTPDTWTVKHQSDGTVKLTIAGQDFSPSSFEYQKKAAETPEETWEVIDYIQLVMDFLGFIPGFGDVIDIINAMIYFYRGKYLEGSLSLVAIIPIAGSALKFGFKAAFKSIGTALVTKAIKRAIKGDTTLWKSYLAKAVKDGNISKADLKVMAEYGDKAAELLRLTPRKLKKYEKQLKTLGVDNFDDVGKLFDEWASYVENLLRVTPAPKTGLSKIASGVAEIPKLIGSGAVKLVKLPFKLTFKVVNFALDVVTASMWGRATRLLKKYFGVSAKTTEQLSNAIKYGYRKKLQTSPQLAAQMLKANKTTPGLISFQKLYDLPTNEIISKLQKLKQTNPKQYKKVAQQIAEQSADANSNIWYRKYIADNVQMFYHLFKPGAVFKGTVDGNVANLIKQIKPGIKSLDVMYNELEGVAEEIGLDENDDPNAVIIPLLISAINYISGDNKEDAKKSDLSQVLDNETFQSIKSEYDELPADESFADRMSKLAENGWDELQLQAFKFLLGQ